MMPVLNLSLVLKQELRLEPGLLCEVEKELMLLRVLDLELLLQELCLGLKLKVNLEAL